MSLSQQHQQPTTGDVNPAQPVPYLSVRVTISHDALPEIVKVLADMDYIICLHTGRGGDNPHFHICIPRGSAESIRLKFKRHFSDQRGNGFLTVKSYNNGLSSFLFYGLHEAHDPIFQGPYAEVIATAQGATKYSKTAQSMLPLGKRAGRDPETSWQLNYNNLVTQTVKYARINKLTGNLKETIEHMLDHTKWEPSFQMVTKGVPNYYYDHYERQRGARRGKRDMSWMDLKC